MGYTAASPLGKSATTPIFKRKPMSRTVVLIVGLVLVIGALILLSTLPKQQPTQVIEVAVPQGSNAH
jgi:hypothetical protein